jgi:uncharacterized protein (DUF1800 family)
MLIYLDNRLNRKQRPNENWARELMELFTLGIGNYTEDDIKQAARAFTGWTHKGGAFTFRERVHDTGVKVFLGQKGKFRGEDIIRIIFEQPAAAEFISRKLWEFFVYEDPDAGLVEELAGVFRKNKYQLKPLLKAIFRSAEFYSARARGSQIKSPVQFAVALLNQLEITPTQWQNVHVILRVLGQDLFYPPNVKGWPGNRAWIDTNKLLLRYNTSSAAVNGDDPRVRRQKRLDEMEEEEAMMGPSRDDDFFEDSKKFKRAAFDAAAFFRKWEGRTAADLVDDLVAYFCVAPLNAEQKKLLVKTVHPKGKPNDVLTLKNAHEAYVRATVHLLLSTAEYQLC